jgi:DNA invertase Pin-like site-specific DNA recombinase
MRAALYVRVSTKDKQQDPTNQLLPLREKAKERKWNIVEEYIEHESAAGKKKRRIFPQMMQDAKDGKFDVLAFWSLDRFSREGALQTMWDLRSLNDAGVEWCSQMEPFLDTEHLGPLKDVLISLIATLAKMESDRRSERAKAAVERLRSEGKRAGGRDPVKVDETELRRLVKEGYTKVAIARWMGCSRGTVVNRIRELGIGQ